MVYCEQRKNEGLSVNRNLTFLNLFAGGGGLSEGFIQAGFRPVAHVESDPAACFTLRTRMSYHWLKSHGQMERYADYLNGILSRRDFYECIPECITGSVFNVEINRATLPGIFSKIDESLKERKLDLIIGGPPCQAYSLVGRSRDSDRMKNDNRNYLYFDYAEFLKRYRPIYFVFENVPGLLSARDWNGALHFDDMRRLFSQYGYQTEFMTLSAEDYGVLQSRKRIILIGKLGGYPGFLPGPDKWKPGALVGEIFDDLPALDAGSGNSAPCRIRSYCGTWQYEAGIRNNELPVTWHQARPNTDQDLMIYRIAVRLWNRKKTRLSYNMLPEHLKTHRNLNSFLDRFKVVAADLPFSHTVLAHIAKDGHYYIHPDIEQNRSITPREAARLQTFPDDYFFESRNGTPRRTSTFRQIGNAVPVLLARKIADRLKEIWV